jgi:hypothetical protein
MVLFLNKKESPSKFSRNQENQVEINSSTALIIKYRIIPLQWTHARRNLSI